MNAPSTVGLIFGKFYPLHRGHIYLIEKASTEVEELHVVLGHEGQRDLLLFEESHLPLMPTVNDRLYWLRKTFEEHHNIHIHSLDESGIRPYPNGWEKWAQRVKKHLEFHSIMPTLIFTGELQDSFFYQQYFDIPVCLINEKREFIAISATKIRYDPYKYWTEIARIAQPFFVKRVCIIDHPNLLSAARRFATLYNAPYTGNSPVLNTWSHMSKYAYRYLFTSAPLYDYRMACKEDVPLPFGRPWLLPTDVVIRADKWPEKLTTEVVYREILSELKEKLLL